MSDMTGRNWEVKHKLLDCAVEYKRLHNLYLDADFEDRLSDALFYKGKAEHFKSLVDRGIEFEPQFQGEHMYESELEESDDRTCVDCGDKTNIYICFIHDDEYYCPCCCPDGYGGLQ